jgi:hypothetical protein
MGGEILRLRLDAAEEMTRRRAEIAMDGNAKVKYKYIMAENELALIGSQAPRFRYKLAHAIGAGDLVSETENLDPQEARIGIAWTTYRKS